MIVLLMGALMLVVPHIGIPNQWKLYFYIGVGIVLLIVGYSLRRSAYLRSIEMADGERSTDSYVESTRKIDWPEEPA